MKEMEQLFRRILELKAQMVLHEGASERTLDDFEIVCGINLPESYREWLKFSNGGELFVPGTILYGIDDLKNADRKKMREEFFTIPSNYLVIGKLNYGDYLCINLQDGHELIQWDHERDEKYCCWNDFQEWLEETIREAME